MGSIRLHGEDMIKSGVITVTTAGTAVAGPDLRFSHRLVLAGHPSNTGVVAVGNHAGDITVATGFVMGASDQVVIEGSGNLSDIIVDSAVNGEQVTYLAY